MDDNRFYYYFLLFSSAVFTWRFFSPRYAFFFFFAYPPPSKTLYSIHCGKGVKKKEKEVMDHEVLFRLYERFILDSPPIRIPRKDKNGDSSKALGKAFPSRDKDYSWDGYVAKENRLDNSISEENDQNHRPTEFVSPPIYIYRRNNIMHRVFMPQT